MSIDTKLVGAGAVFALTAAVAYLAVPSLVDSSLQYRENFSISAAYLMGAWSSIHAVALSSAFFASNYDRRIGER